MGRKIISGEWLSWERLAVADAINRQMTQGLASAAAVTREQLDNWLGRMKLVTGFQYEALLLNQMRRELLSGLTTQEGEVIT